MEIMAYSRCTKRAGYDDEAVENHLKPGTTYGPDQGWVLLNAGTLATFCSGVGATLQHRGKTDYNHVCASYSAWAFDAQDSSNVCCCAFMHYNISAKLNAMLGSPDEASSAAIFTVKGAAFLAQYQALSAALSVKGRAVHVWQRAAHREIAFDFCVNFG